MVSLTNDLKKWTYWGFEAPDFPKHPKFSNFILNSPLGPQMKIFKDLSIDKNGVVGILVEGEWTPADDVLNRFETKLNNKETFIVEKTTQDVYTYLENGRGLQKHHPHHDLEPRPITRLTEDEYSETLKVARLFNRAGDNSQRTFILQVVSSYIGGCNTNASKLLCHRKHPWIRVICDDGYVYEAGFGWYKPVKLLGYTTFGRFSHQDIWNYKRPKKRVVTNIAITPAEAEKLQKYILGYHQDNINRINRISFNILRQNCSSFVHHALKEIGIDLPTKIYLCPLLKKISPDAFKAIGRIFRNIPVPKKISIICKKVFGALTFLPISMCSCCMGTACGRSGRAFVNEGESDRLLHPPLQDPTHFFSSKKFYYYLPGLIQEWQEQQASTQIYNSPCKLSIVPL